MKGRMDVILQVEIEFAQPKALTQKQTLQLIKGALDSLPQYPLSPISIKLKGKKVRYE